ncbi:MAG: four helix bundle protein, partial [Pseudomonadota bacterium]
GRKTTPEYVRSIYFAYGSTGELKTQLLLSQDLGYLNKESLSELQRDIREVERMLKSMIQSLENKHLNP